MNLASKLFKGDRVIWILFLFFCAISLVEVFSATSTLAYKSTTHWTPIVRHASFLLAGVVVVLLLHNIPCRFYSLLSVFLPISVVLLILTFFIGVEINGEKRWLNIVGITFQPSEITKLATIGYTAVILSLKNWLTDKQKFWYIQGGTALVCGLIFFTNGSTAILLFSIVQMMVFIGQISLVRLLKFWGILIAAVSLMVFLLLTMPGSVINYMPDRVQTWKARIERFSDSEPPVAMEAGKTVNIDGENYQVIHAKIALARGGLFGRLPGHSQQRDFLPQAYSDFIYAIIIEEMGIAGGIFVLFLYTVLLVRVGIIARRCDKLFPKYLVMGCGLLIVVQALINMAVAVDLIPVTGQPLPLISRGGTSTVISCAYIGIILSVSRFGANMGNVEEIEELPVEENLDGSEPEKGQQPLENGSAPVEEAIGRDENGVEEAEENPLKAVMELKEETTTETKI